MRQQKQQHSRIFARNGRIAKAALTLMISISVVLASAAAQAQTYATFEAPGAGTGAYEGTVPIGINTAGVVTGFDLTAGSASHGFVRAANGKITDFSAKGAGTASGQGTFAVGINTAGTTAGMYFDANNVY